MPILAGRLLESIQFNLALVGFQNARKGAQECPLARCRWYHDHLLLGLQPEGWRIRICIHLDRFLQSPEALAQIVAIQQQQRED